MDHDEFGEAPTVAITPPAPTKTAEAWADQKEHFVLVPARAPKGVKQVKKFSWQFAAAKGLHGWAVGQEMSEADYDAAIHAACNVVMR